MPMSVVIVPSGGIAVTVAPAGYGVPMTEAPTGLAVTFAPNGIPVAGISAGPPTAPVNTVAPFIVGTAATGQTLTAATGAWTGSPAPTYTYQWKRGGVNIGGATASTYLLVTADLAATITCTVTATNSQGSASATTAGVGPVAQGTPANTVLPAISGSTVVGSVLTATSGTWTGTPTPTYAYQWVRGVPATLPANTVLPAISGSTTVGSVLTTTNGTWTGTPTPTYARQWKRNGAAISGETALTYTTVTADLTTTITCTVTATNTAGSVGATSAGVGPITSGSGDVDVAAWITAVGVAGGSVSSPRQTAVETFVGALKSAGVWAKLDRYWLIAGENAGAAGVDMKARVSMTVLGSPVFTANKGYVTSFSNNVSTNFTPSTAGGLYTQNSATLGGFVNTARVSGSTLIEFGCANAAYTIVAGLNAYEGTYSVARINDNGPAIGNDSTHTARGGWIVTRTGASACAVYYNGSSAGYPNGGAVGSSVSSGLPDAPFALGCVNQGGTFTNWSGDQISSFYVGSGLNSTEALALYNAESALMTSIAVLP